MAKKITKQENEYRISETIYRFGYWKGLFYGLLMGLLIGGILI